MLRENAKERQWQVQGDIVAVGTWSTADRHVFCRMARERIPVLSLLLRCSRVFCCCRPRYCPRVADDQIGVWLIERRQIFGRRLLWRCGRNVGAEGTCRYRQYPRFLRVYCLCRFMQAGMQRLRQVRSGLRSVCQCAQDCAGDKVSALNTVVYYVSAFSVTCVP